MASISQCCEEEKHNTESCLRDTIYFCMSQRFSTFPREGGEFNLVSEATGNLRKHQGRCPSVDGDVEYYNDEELYLHFELTKVTKRTTPHVTWLL